jgi:hypothetical protein
LADAILALVEGGEANDDNNDNDVLGVERGERRGLDDHDDDNDNGDDGTDGPRCHHRGGGSPFPVEARIDALLVGPLAASRCPREQGRDDLNVEGWGGMPPLCADVRDQT